MDAKDPSPEADPAATPDAAPEAVARRRIDAQLRQAGWQVQDRAAVPLRVQRRRDLLQQRPRSRADGAAGVQYALA